MKFSKWILKFPIFLALISASLFGLATPLSKPLLNELNPIQLSGFLYLGAALILFPIIVKEKDSLRLSLFHSSNKKNYLYLSGSIISGGITGPIFLLYGLSISTAGTTSLLLNFETTFTAVIAFLFFKEHFSKRTWVANIGIFFSGVILSINSEFDGNIGFILILLATICWGLDNNFASNIDSISPVQYTFLKGITAGLVNILLALLIQEFDFVIQFILIALIIGAFSYGISIILYITSSQQLGASRAQMYFSSAPYWGLLFAILLLNEPLTIIQLLSGLLMISFLILLFRDLHNHQHNHHYIFHTHPHTHEDIHHSHKHPDHNLTDIESQWHEHKQTTHNHAHWPDLHHKHSHE